MGKPGRNRVREEKQRGATLRLIPSGAAISPPRPSLLSFFPSQRWRDAEREMKNHNVSHIDGGNFIKLRSSGV